MVHEQVTALIQNICDEDERDFQAKVAFLYEKLSDMEREELKEHLLKAGVIPERFAHDSTEEKLYAKYCDIILAKALSHLGIEAQAIGERSDAADVFGKIAGKYSLVGDAKAFRLSRTAKNQKDFKVESLSRWRKGADYACLAAPAYQYPGSRSQIYVQAVRYNVTLLSYTHFHFMLTCKTESCLDLESLWRVSASLDTSKNAQTYWEVIDTTMCECLGVELADWQQAREEALKILPKQARTEITFWESEKKRIKQLNHDAAVEELIKALKIDSKIDVIKRTAGI